MHPVHPLARRNKQENREKKEDFTFYADDEPSWRGGLSGGSGGKRATPDVGCRKMRPCEPVALGNMCVASNEHTHGEGISLENLLTPVSWVVLLTIKTVAYNSLNTW
jgi:hypothetical protein